MLHRQKLPAPPYPLLASLKSGQFDLCITHNFIHGRIASKLR